MAFNMVDIGLLAKTEHDSREHFKDGYDFDEAFRKPFLPAQPGNGTPGTITVTDQNGTRTIQSNNLPVDAKIGDWPMTRYAELTAIDPNPGTPAARGVSFALASPARIESNFRALRPKAVSSR